MRTLRKKRLLLLGLVGGFVASIPVASAVDKDGKLTPPSLDQIQARQTSEGITIGAATYHTEQQAKSAFGKLHPYEYGILPVLVVMKNDSKNTVRLQNMKIAYAAPGGNIEAVPAAEVKYARSPRRPSYGPGPIPGVRLKGKNPLDNPVIEERAFAAKMLPPGETAHGFVYFRSGRRPGARLYITGLQDAATGKDLFYLDIPLE